MIELPFGSLEQDLELFKSHFILPPEFTDLFSESIFNRWNYNYCNYKFFCGLGEFKKWNQTSLVHNFVYDKKLETVFVNLLPASHPQFVACLYTLRKLANGQLPKGKHTSLIDFPYTFCEGIDSLQDLSSEWINEGQGFYLSSVSNSVYKSKEFKLSHQERLQFDGYTFKDW